MALIDFILNVAALMLWLNWLSVRFDPLVKTSAASLVGTLRKADRNRPKRWIFMVSLGLLLLIRALAYWQICAPLHRTPSLHLGIANITFRSDFFLWMLLFSVLSFLVMLASFYFWMLLLSVANFHVPDTDPFQKMIRLYLGRFERWPRALRILIPFVIGAAGWLVFHPALSYLRIVSPAKSMEQVFEQSVFFGAAAYLAWKYLVVSVLLLHLLNSYVYLGNHSFWTFINTTALHLLYPLRWLPLRVGKVDFLPVAAIALVFLMAESFVRLPVYFYHLLKF